MQRLQRRGGLALIAAVLVASIFLTSIASSIVAPTGPLCTSDSQCSSSMFPQTSCENGVEYDLSNGYRCKSDGQCCMPSLDANCSLGIQKILPGRTCSTGVCGQASCCSPDDFANGLCDSLKILNVTVYKEDSSIVSEENPALPNESLRIEVLTSNSGTDSAINEDLIFSANDVEQEIQQISMPPNSQQSFYFDYTIPEEQNADIPVSFELDGKYYFSDIPVVLPNIKVIINSVKYKDRFGKIIQLKDGDTLLAGVSYNITSTVYAYSFKKKLESGVVNIPVEFYTDTNIFASDSMILVSKDPDAATFEKSFAPSDEGVLNVKVTANERKRITESDYTDNEKTWTFKVVKKKPIELQKIEITPDYLKKYKIADDWIKYSDVFNKTMACVIVLNDSNPITGQIQIGYIINISAVAKSNAPGLPPRIPIIAGRTMCDNNQNCTINISANLIYPDDSITCKITLVMDSFSTTIMNKYNSTKLPSFNLKAGNISVTNGIYSKNIIAGKPLIVRIFPEIDSNLISELDVPFQVSLNVTGLDGKINKYDITMNNLKKYPRYNDLIADPTLRLKKDIDWNGVYAYELLRYLKAGNDSANFLNLPQLEYTAAGQSYSFRNFVDLSGGNGNIKESDETDNSANGEEYKTHNQAKDFKIAFLIFTNNSKITAHESARAKELAENDFSFLVSAFPLTQARSNFTLITAPVQINYNPEELKGENAAAAGKAKKVRDIINEHLNNYSKNNPGYNLVVGLEFDYNILLGQSGSKFEIFGGITNYMKNSNPIIIFAGEKVENPGDPASSITKDDGSVLVHEAGHAISKFEEDYSTEAGTGKEIIGQAIPFTEYGWLNFDSKLPTSGIKKYSGSKINIWAVNGETNGMTNAIDKPEFRTSGFANQDKVKELTMGDKYLNIMGVSGLYHSWISTRAYDNLTATLMKQGVISPPKMPAGSYHSGADITSDGKVDFVDFQRLLDNWQKSSCAELNDWCNWTDFVGGVKSGGQCVNPTWRGTCPDGKVNFLDFQKILDNWDPSGVNK